MRNQAGRRTAGIGAGLHPISSPNTTTVITPPIFGKAGVLNNNVRGVVGPATGAPGLAHPIKIGYRRGGPENGAAPWTAYAAGPLVGGSGSTLGAGAGAGAGTQISGTQIGGSGGSYGGGGAGGGIGGGLGLAQP